MTLLVQFCDHLLGLELHYAPRHVYDLIGSLLWKSNEKVTKFGPPSRLWPYWFTFVITSSRHVYDLIGSLLWKLVHQHICEHKHQTTFVTKFCRMTNYWFTSVMKQPVMTNYWFTSVMKQPVPFTCQCAVQCRVPFWCQCRVPFWCQVPRAILVSSAACQFGVKCRVPFLGSGMQNPSSPRVVNSSSSPNSRLAPYGGANWEMKRSDHIRQTERETHLLPRTRENTRESLEHTEYCSCSRKDKIYINEC